MMLRTYRPGVVLLYLSVVIVFSFLTLQPICVLLTYAAACIALLLSRGARTFGRAVVASLVAALVIAVFNMVINPLGATVIARPWGTTFTFESLLYGACAGLMLSAAVMWFMFADDVFGADGLIAVLGRRMPSVALLISSALRFIPDIVARGRAITTAQTALVGIPQSGLPARTSFAARISSVCMAVSMEDALVTADSMQARGYGACLRRTSWRDRPMGLRDIMLCALVVLLSVATAIFFVQTVSSWSFFPSLPQLTFSWGFVCYGVLLFLPAFMEGWAHVRERR